MNIREIAFEAYFVKHVVDPKTIGDRFKLCQCIT